MTYTIEDLIRRTGREPGGGRSLMPLVIALARYWKEHPAEIKRIWREALREARINPVFKIWPRATAIDITKFRRRRSASHRR